MPSVYQVGDTSDSYPLKVMEENSQSQPLSNGNTDASCASSLSTGGSPKRRKLVEDDDDDDSNIHDLLVYYAKNSTMHGIPTIVGSELYRGRHIFWIVVVGVMAIFLGTVIYWQMSDYYNYPTVTSVDIHYVTEDDFPAITVCDPNYINVHLLKLVKDNFTLFQLTKLTEIPGFYHRFMGDLKHKVDEPPEDNNTDTAVLMGKLLYFAEKYLSSPKTNKLYCSWGDYHFKEHCPGSYGRITEMGPCSTIDTRKIVREIAEKENIGRMPAISKAMRGLTLYFDTDPTDIPYRIFQSDGFKVVLHHPDLHPLPLSSGFLIGGKTTVEVEISKNVKQGLPPPFNAFGSGACVDTETESFENPLKRFKTYSKELCEAECFVDFVVHECGGCRHFFHPGNESICPIKHLAECYREAEVKYYSGNTSQKSVPVASTCNCLMPCRQEFYSARVSSAAYKQTEYFKQIQAKANIQIYKSMTYVHFFYSDPVVTTMKQVAIYSTEGLLGNIGGQIGLFMGFSLVTVAEMLELIFLLVTRGRSLKAKVKQQKEVEALVRASMKMDT